MLDHVALESRPAARSEPARRSRPRATSATAAVGVDVALDDVPAEPVGGAQGRLEVHAASRARATPSEVSSSVWFIDVGLEAPGAQARRPSGRRRRRPPSRRRSRSAASSAAIADPRARVVALDPLDRSHLGDQPGEHLTTPASGRGRACPRRCGSHSTASARSASARRSGPAPASSGRASAPPSSDGREEEPQLVELARLPEGPGERRPALEHEAGEVAAAELVERRPDAVRPLARADDHLDPRVRQRVDARGGARRGPRSRSPAPRWRSRPAGSRAAGAPRSRRRRGSAGGRPRPRAR